MMKKYIWLNPVVMKAYPLEVLDACMKQLGYEIVYPQQNHPQQVRDKYAQALKLRKKPILDTRCPLMVQHFKKTSLAVEMVEIEPILIHVARELATREDLLLGEKMIITPCTSLKEMGENLCLPQTKFFTWDEFIQQHQLQLQAMPLEDSPIPFGFFDTISQSILKITEPQYIVLSNEDLKGIHLIEGLYCHNGCHNGDGVQWIRKSKKE